MSKVYIVESGTALKVKHQQFQLFRQQQQLFKVPVNQIDSISIIGYCHLSHGAIQTALYRKIPVTYYSLKGYYLGCLQVKSQPLASYVIAQAKQAQNAKFIRQQAEIIVRAKLHNSRILLMRINRRHPNQVTQNAIAELKKIINCLDVHLSLESLRGYEGKGANIYFQGLSKLFQGEFTFTQRTSRPPQDPINSLLSFGYTLLCQHLTSKIQLARLHTDLGNLHTLRDNHPALVLDLMEEFRAQIVDSLVIYLVNKKIFSARDFTSDSCGVYLKQEALKIFLKHWSQKISTELTHPQSKQKINLDTCLDLQVQEYIACLTGKNTEYRPMIWKK